MCSFHGLCTHRDVDCQIQHPTCAILDNNAASSGCCYFCPTRAHITYLCDGPCLHCGQVRVHQSTTCQQWNTANPGVQAAQVPVSPLVPALLPPPPEYSMLITVDPLTTPEFVSRTGILASYRIPKITATVMPTPATAATTPAPWAHIIPQGPPLGIPTDLAMEVINQIEWMNL
uniref:Uncharacterized protein n=1 Tax=Romanomermis culicivorax TaxID=13658 RepID=A0A915IVB8_ROMCU